MIQRVAGEPVASEPLLKLSGLGVDFSGHAAVRALDLEVAAGETVALVGESGCGKSTTALAILRLLSDAARLSSAVRFAGRELLSLKERQLVVELQ